MYIADYSNHRIRKVTVSTGIISTIAGTGTASYSGDGGAATSAGLYYPTGIVLDASGTQVYYYQSFRTYFFHFLLPLDALGNVYIADFSNNCIRKVTISTGFIITIAGTGTSGSFSGDGGAATGATLKCPRGVALDSVGN